MHNDAVLVDLNRNGLKIYQKPQGFCFGMDSVLLAAYAKAWKGERVIDLCSGGGVVPVLMSARCPNAEYTGIEIQKEMVEMAQKSIEANNLCGKIKILCGDIRHGHSELVPRTFDVCTVNPPYMKASSGMEHTARNVARHELLCGINDVAAAAENLLKFGGKLFLVHRTDRLTDVLTALRNHSLEPKTLRFIHPAQSKPSKLFLLSAVKGAASGPVTEPPLIIYKEPGVYNDEITKIYNK
jgi:tRNA1Val (adenine37-N6)-methyltransferase